MTYVNSFNKNTVNGSGNCIGPNCGKLQDLWSLFDKQVGSGNSIGLQDLGYISFTPTLSGQAKANVGQIQVNKGSSMYFAPKTADQSHVGVGTINNTGTVTFGLQNLGNIQFTPVLSGQAQANVGQIQVNRGSSMYFAPKTADQSHVGVGTISNTGTVTFGLQNLYDVPSYFRY